MKLVTDLQNHLRNNPKGYWFKRKLYGWGWIPARPQGWTVLILYVVLVGLISTRITEDMDEAQVLTRFILPFGGMTLLLIIICYWKGERPRWQWGKQIDD